MNKIKVLSDNLANQIAAGEVVERPAAVIKELIENSIDAGANRILVEIELGGRRLMRVADNGEGMVRDDAVLAFERHATSKISTLEDLSAISTLGFRGEALASIASVAKVELVTKTEVELAATKVLIEGGRLVDIKDAARDTGTTVSVRDLFFNTPARRKFMRSEATENYHIASIVTHYALAHPEIAFTLRNNGREVMAASPAKDLRERAFQVFGGGILESLLPVSGGREYVAKVSGFVSAPRERRTTKDSQYFFVNQRFVRDKTIAAGLIEGYRSVLPHGVYPVAFLFLNVPIEEVDVNVHPAKTEVRFRRNEAVKDAIAEAVRGALAKAGIVPVASDNPIVPPDEPHRMPEQASLAAQVGAAVKEASSIGVSPAVGLEEKRDIGNQTPFDLHPGPEPIIEDTQLDLSDSFSKAAEMRTVSAEVEPSPAGNRMPPNNALPPINSAERLMKPIEAGAISLAKIQPIQQLHESFIIAVDDVGLLLIDQHAAHERILFDKFRQKETEREIESQNLLLPETIDLTPAQSQAFYFIEGELQALGFRVMQLSGRTVAITSIPTDLPPAEARNLFAELLDSVEIEKRGSAKSTLRDDIAASLACKAAVKIHMKLTHEKMQWLIECLLKTSSPTTCPHGRPAILRLSRNEIERGFQRT